MSDLGNDIPQEIPTRKTEGDFNLIVVCSVLIIAVAVITVYYLTEKDERICCNFAQELNITTKLAEIEIRLENLHKSLEKEMQRESEGAIKVCRNGWIQFSDSCYYFSKDKYSWSMSLLKCRDEGGYLAEINDAGENIFFKEQAKLLNDHFWLGGSDQLEEKDWIWVTSRTHFSSGLYTDWYAGQPSNTGGKEHCLDLRVDWYRWNDAPCSELNRYVCEIPPGVNNAES